MSTYENGSEINDFVGSNNQDRAEDTVRFYQNLVGPEHNLLKMLLAGAFNFKAKS